MREKIAVFIVLAAFAAFFVSIRIIDDAKNLRDCGEWDTEPVALSGDWFLSSGGMYAVKGGPDGAWKLQSGPAPAALDASDNDRFNFGKIRMSESQNEYVLSASGGKYWAAGNAEGEAFVVSEVPAKWKAIQARKNFQYYSQTDPRWKRFKYSWMDVENAGCGLTASTMIINYLSEASIDVIDAIRVVRGNSLDIHITPRIDMPKYLALASARWKFRYDTIKTMPKIYEIKTATDVHRSRVLEALGQNRIVLMSTTPNPRIGYVYGVEHFLVLRGFDRDGNIIVNDPLPGHSFHTKAPEYVEANDKSYVYVAPADALMLKMTQAYSFPVGSGAIVSVGNATETENAAN